MKNFTGNPSRAAVEISIADIKKQPSPVTVKVCRPWKAFWAPSAAGIDQPIDWLPVGLKKVRGCRQVYASVAQYCETVTSTKVRASGEAQCRRASKNATGSTPHCAWL